MDSSGTNTSMVLEKNGAGTSLAAVSGLTNTGVVNLSFSGIINLVPSDRLQVLFEAGGTVFVDDDVTNTLVIKFVDN